jgi:hypothetical protein
MCRGAYKTFSTEGTVFSFFDSRIRLRGVFLSIQHLGQKKTLFGDSASKNEKTENHRSENFLCGVDIVGVCEQQDSVINYNIQNVKYL